MRVPGDRAEEDILESEAIQTALDEEFEAVDRHFCTPRKPIDGVAGFVMIEDEITHLLVLHFRPFMAVLLAQIVRNAASRLTRSPGTKAVFTVKAIKGVDFLTYQETFSSGVQYLVITTGKRLPNRTKKGR